MHGEMGTWEQFVAYIAISDYLTPRAACVRAFVRLEFHQIHTGLRVPNAVKTDGREGRDVGQALHWER